MPVCMKPNFMSSMALHSTELLSLAVYRPMSEGANEDAGCIGKAVESFSYFFFS